MNSTPDLEVDVHHVKQLLDNQSGLVLLDCREEDEHQLVRIEGAQLLPMSQIQARIEELEQHRDKHVVVHCHHGGRSYHVTCWLRDQGFSNVQNMQGGIDAWSLHVDPSLPRY